jgi:HK97 family phage portal protein
MKLPNFGSLFKRGITNAYNKVFFFGGKFTTNDDADSEKYVKEAYNINTDVFSIVNQISRKLIAIPYTIKKVDNVKTYKELKTLRKATRNNPSNIQRMKAMYLESKSFFQEDFNLPFERPNVSQSWDEFFMLSEDFLNLTGNVFWYKLMPEDGMNAGKPIQVYVLPSHYMQIVLKENADMLSVESPVDYYIMKQHNDYIKFKQESVVHISVNNPNFGLNGEHLYGQSYLRAAWKNIVASNKGLDLNINTLKNGGVFGFIHAKGQSLTPDQAVELKDRLKEMNSNPEDLSRLAGASSELGFTKLSLTADELKPFEYLKYNQKAICNALSWSDALLNNDDGGKYDKQELELKRVLLNKVIPDAELLAEAFTKGVLQHIKGYEKAEFVFDYKDLPELQDDLETLMKWISVAITEGVITRNEAREVIGMETHSDSNMDIITVKDDVMTLEEAIMPKEDLI